MSPKSDKSSASETKNLDAMAESFRSGLSVSDTADPDDTSTGNMVDLDSLAHEHYSTQGGGTSTGSAGSQSNRAHSISAQHHSSNAQAQRGRHTQGPAPSGRSQNPRNDRIESLDPRDTTGGPAVQERKDSGACAE